MKSNNNIQKDWQELLREKAGNVAGAQPEVSFAELKEKMVAAAAEAGASAGAVAGEGVSAGVGASAGASASAGVGASAGSRRRGLSWLKYAAAVAVIGAAGAMLLTNPDKGRDLSSSTAENRKADEVTVVSEPVLETEPDVEAVNDVEGESALEAALATNAISAVAEGPSVKTARDRNTSKAVNDVRDETVPVDLSKLTADDAASSNAPSGNNHTSTNTSNSTTAGSTAAASDATPTGNTHAGAVTDEAAPAAGTPKQDPFAEPVKPLKKQLRRFSVGASGFLASNGIGNGQVSTRNMMSDMVTYTDKNGKVFYSYSAPSVRYNHSAPISGGISLRYNFTPVFYAESGLRLTYLHTWISPSGAAQDLLYAGIPLGVGGNFAHLGNASFYASAYGMLSKCMMGHNSAGFPSNYAQLSDIPLMWSAGASLGASYNITRTFGLFAEPTVSYYFPTSNAPQTIYKENPWYFTLNLGVRFNLN